MKRQTIPSMLALLGTGAMAVAAQSFDWPQWQGHDRNATSKETGLLKEWPKDGPPLAWKVGGLGGGDSTPSVASGRIYGMSHRGSEEFVWALSEKDGKEIWGVRIAPAHTLNWPQSKEGPSATPTVDGDRLYVMGLAGNVVCLRAADGRVVWLSPGTSKPASGGHFKTSQGEVGVSYLVGEGHVTVSTAFPGTAIRATRRPFGRAGERQDGLWSPSSRPVGRHA